MPVYSPLRQLFDHAGHMVQEERLVQKMAAKKISWPTMADIWPTCDFVASNIVVSFALVGPTSRPTSPKRKYVNCWPSSGRHPLGSPKVPFCRLGEVASNITGSSFQYIVSPKVFSPNNDCLNSEGRIYKTIAGCEIYIDPQTYYL